MYIAETEIINPALLHSSNERENMLLTSLIIQEHAKEVPN